MGIECLLDLKLKSKISVNAELIWAKCSCFLGAAGNRRVGSSSALERRAGKPGLYLPKVERGVGGGGRWGSGGKGHSSFL